jgi:hypothetical protein
VAIVQLPALNTPQFSWGRTRMARQPQPLPPIFQPEVAAEAVVWTAHHPRRELYVGWPTIKTIIGNKVAPGLVDRYLARTGVEAQQIDEPVRPDHRDNLFAPAPGDFAAHGKFDERAKPKSVQLWASLHRRWLGAAGAAGALAAALGVFRRNGSRREQ